MEETITAEIRPHDFALVESLACNSKFIGISSIVYGVLNCLWIIGALVGVPMIIAGMRLNESANELRQMLLSRDATGLIRAVEKQNRFFNTWKILIIAYLCFTVVYLFFAIFLLSMYWPKA